MFGGFAAGAVLGLRAKRLSFGVGSGALLAAASVIVDITDGKIVGKPLDGMTVCSYHWPCLRPSCRAGHTNQSMMLCIAMLCALPE